MKSQTAKFKLDLQHFAEDQKPAEEAGTELEDVNKKYIDAINELKSKSVDKEKYEALEAQNKELLNAVLNGGSINSGAPEVVDKPDIKQLREDLYGGKTNLSNLEYAKKTLALRKALMDEGKIDPFVPVGENISPEPSDFEHAEEVARVIQECIDSSEGDSVVFTNLLQTKTIDVMPRVAMPKFLKK